MTTGKYTWALTVTVGVPVLIIIVLILAGLAVGCWRLQGEFVDEDEWVIGKWCFGALAAIVAVLAFLGYVPWASPFSDYHAWNEVQGTVQETSSRLVSDGDKGVTQRYVIKFAESDELYGCDDSRCTQAAKGKHLRLLCQREWQYQAYSGWGCRYGQKS